MGLSNYICQWLKHEKMSTMSVFEGYVLGQTNCTDLEAIFGSYVVYCIGLPTQQNYCSKPQNLPISADG